MTKKPEITLLDTGITQFINENRPALDRLAAEAVRVINGNRSFIEQFAKTAEQLNRKAKILEPAVKAAGMTNKKIRTVVVKLLLEIAAGENDAKSSHGGKRSGEKRREKAAGWQAVAGPRADEIKRKWPQHTANRVATIICEEGEIEGLAGHRQVADFLKKRYR